jgi:hypothetical protein
MGEARVGEERTRQDGTAEPGMDLPPADGAAHTMDVVEGEVGSAALKDPAEVEVQGRRPEPDTLPEARLDTGSADRPAGQA